MGESKLQLNIERKTKNFGGKGCYPKFFCVAMHPKEAAGGRCCRYFTKYFKMCSFSGILQRFCNASFGTILLYLKKEEESGMPEQNIPMNMQQRKK